MGVCPSTKITCNRARSRVVWRPVITEPADVWRALVRRSLLTARKERAAVRVSALRSVLSAIDNAETPDRVDVAAPMSGAIAGAAAGVGATEVTRRSLTDDEIRRLVAVEIDERRRAADDYAAAGHPERAATLEAEAAVLDALLGDV
jgi:uncharacterized protein